jgi:hypothetical protein
MTSVRAVLAVLTAAVLVTALAAPLGCASNERPRERERRARRYEGPVIDLWAHVDDADRFARNAADPRVQKIGAVVDAPAGRPDETRAQNDRVLALARDNKKVIPIPSVFPYDGQAALDELNRVADQGAVLVHLSAAPQGIDPTDARLASIVQRAGERGVALFVEGASPGDPTLFSRVIALAEKHPATQLVVVHMGLTQFREAAMLVYKQKAAGWGDNVWLDMSGAATLYAGSPLAPEIVWLVRKLQSRVIFGSNYPSETSSSAVEAVQALGLEENEQAGVLYANAARLLKMAS